VTSGPARTLVLALILAASWASAGAQAPAPAQDETDRVRLVGFRTQPTAPEFGVPFDLELTLRVAPGTTVFLPDTLNPTDASASAGRGAWRAAEGPADSVDVVATYPLMGFLSGQIRLPPLEAWVGPAPAAEAGAMVHSAADLDRLSAAEAETMRLAVVPTGFIRLEALHEMAGAGDSLLPRPPADVLGARWSLWLVLGAVIAAVALAVTGGALLSEWRGRRRAAPHAFGRSPRDEALHELERIRSLGWHREGRLADFYDATTGVLRRFSEQEERDWGTALTSTELMDRIRARWGPDPIGELAAAVIAAERVKFGRDRPGPEAAEAHWKAVRDWIASRSGE
jgi:hypothetical protein